MNLFRSVRVVTEASGSGSGPIDWEAVAEAAKASVDPGALDLSEAEERGYADDVREARERLRSVGGVEFDLPRTIEVQNRHHWIDANIRTFERVMRPFEEHSPAVLPGVARAINTGSMAFMLSFLANNVLGQYDPLLLAEGDDVDHELYFVHPNIEQTAATLQVDYPRFRRWIAFHEVSHAAEFGAAPWLAPYLERRLEDGIESFTEGGFDRDSFRELNVAMTAVEGYAELLMDLAFDDDYADLRAKLDARRRQGGPLTKLVRRALGLGLKRRQYERGARFFRTVAEARDVRAASAVWELPENLPTETELDRPERWLSRVNP